MYFIIFNNVVFRLFLFVVVLLIIFSMNDISIIWVGHLEMYVCTMETLWKSHFLRFSLSPFLNQISHMDL